MRCLAVMAILGGAGGFSPPAEAEVWVFFSPDSPDASPLFVSLRGLWVRPVLLVERYRGAREPSAAFLATLKAAGEVRVVDEEGLLEARRLGVRDLPAVAVRRGGRSHVVSGTRVDVQELLRCPR